MLERLVNMTIRFFVGVWVVRYLGPENYGVYSYALSFTGVFVAFVTLGLDNIVVRNLSREGSEEGKILGTALLLRIGSAIVTMGVVAAIVLTVNDRWLTQLAVLIVSGHLIFKASDVFDLWFQSQIKSKYPVRIRIAAITLYCGGQVGFILLGLPVLAFVGLYVVQIALQAGGTYLIYRWVRGSERPDWRFDWWTAKSMLNDSWPLIFASLSIAVYMKIDQVMLGQMSGEEAVGIYATAVKLSEMWYFIPTAIAGSVFPKIVSSKENATRSVYRQRMQALYDLAALVGYTVIVPVSLLASPIVLILFGEAFADSAAILVVHIWAFLFVALGVVRSRWLVAENFTHFAMLAAILGAISNVGMNWFLIPGYEGVGAAWATLLSQVLSTYVSGLFYQPIRSAFAQMTRSVLAIFRLRSALNGIKNVMNAN